MKTKRTRANPVACMYNKNVEAYSDRRLHMDNIVSDYAYELATAEKSSDDRHSIMDVYPLLYLNPKVSVADTVSKFRGALDSVYHCNAFPNFWTCDNTLLCEFCLSRRRYRWLKALEDYRLEVSGKGLLTLRKHSISIPRGIFFQSWGQGVYLLYNGYLNRMNSCYKDYSYSYQLNSTQHFIQSEWALDGPQYSNDLYTFMWAILEGPMLYDPTKPSTVAKTIEERTRRFDNVRHEIMLGGCRKELRHAIFTGDTLNMSILQSILLERTALSRMNYPGVCSRVIIYPNYNVNCVTLELQSLIVDAPKEPEKAEKELLFFGGSSSNNTRKIRLMPGSDIYATSKVETQYAKLSSNVHTLHKHIENLFPFKMEVSNLLPLELFMYTLGIKAYSDSITSSGLFRRKINNGEETQTQTGETGLDQERSQIDSVSEECISEQDDRPDGSCDADGSEPGVGEVE